MMECYWAEKTTAKSQLGGKDPLTPPEAFWEVFLSMHMKTV